MEEIEREKGREEEREKKGERERNREGERLTQLGLPQTCQDRTPSLLAVSAQQWWWSAWREHHASLTK